MKTPFGAIDATRDEIDAVLPGDRIVPDADVVMDRAMSLTATPEMIWPWLIQLGKHRVGWYLTRSVERFLPRSRRASRSIIQDWQGLRVGTVIPDYGGREATFEVAILERPNTLVYSSRRGRTDVSWAMSLRPESMSGREVLPDKLSRTRLQLRLRLGPVRHKWLAETVGGLFDAVTVAGLAAGLRERLQDNK